MSKPRFSVRGGNIINGDTGLIVACCEPHSGIAQLFVDAANEVERLRAAITTEADYCQGHADKIQNLTPGAAESNREIERLHSELSRAEKTRQALKKLWISTSDNAAHSKSYREFLERQFDESNPAFVDGQSEPPAPHFDQAEFDAMTEKGTKAWAGVENAANWVEELRGNEPPAPQPESLIHRDTRELLEDIERRDAAIQSGDWDGEKCPKCDCGTLKDSDGKRWCSFIGCDWRAPEGSA